jgi:hypothetical protein
MSTNRIAECIAELVKTGDRNTIANMIILLSEISKNNVGSKTVQPQPKQGTGSHPRQPQGQDDFFAQELAKAQQFNPVQSYPLQENREMTPDEIMQRAMLIA